MVKYQFNGHRSGGADYQRWLRLKHKIEAKGGCYGSLSLDKGNMRDEGAAFVIRMPWMSQRELDQIVQPPPKPEPDILPTLADEVADTICDPNTKEAFKKFANLLIEKLEKK